MESQVSEISPVLVELKVAVPWGTVHAELEQNFKAVARSAKVRGFRPGKVPAKVVRQVFGKRVRGEVTATMVEQGLVAALTKHKLQIVEQPDITELPKIHDGEPLRFTARVEVQPTIEHVDTSELVVYRGDHEVPDERIDAEVENLRKQNAAVQVPEPVRGAKNGDLLVVSYDVVVDGEPKPELAAERRPIELGSDSLLDEFEAALVGAQPGEALSVELTMGDDHPNDELAGKKVQLQGEILELRERLLPELDDEFAKDCGDYATLLELRLDIRKRLEQEATEQSEASQKDQVVDALVTRNDIPIPPSMVRRQQAQMAMEFQSLLGAYGGGMQVNDDLLQGMEKRATRNVRAAILLGALAKQENVSVDETDIERKFKEIEEKTGKNAARLRAEYVGKARDALESQMLEEKLVTLLLSRATIRDGAPPEETTAEPEAGETAPESTP